MTGKTALITGATQGLGLASAGQLLPMGARVLITGRDRLERTVTQLRAQAPGAQVEGLLGDFSRLDSVRALAVNAGGLN